MTEFKEACFLLTTSSEIFGTGSYSTFNPSTGTAIFEPCMDDTNNESGKNFASVGNALDAVNHQGRSPLFYEQTATTNSHFSSLEVVADTDATIKIHLPLRDDGPARLNIATAVNGTAAAGLECAEDAAFFLLTYNKMRCTVHATKIEKEAAAQNLRRKSELKRKSCTIPHTLLCNVLQLNFLPANLNADRVTE